MSYFFNSSVFWYNWIISSCCAIKKWIKTARVLTVCNCVYFLYDWLYCCPAVWWVFHTLPQHLTGQLSVCLFHVWLPSIHELRPNISCNKMYSVGENCFRSKSDQAFYDDCIRWILIHLMSSIKYALNCSHCFLSVGFLYFLSVAGSNSLNQAWEVCGFFLGIKVIIN